MRPQEAEQTLRTARADRRSIEPFTDQHAELDEQWAYDVQGLDRQRRVAAGETVIGAKLGLTSAAKQTRMKVDRPVVGFLTDEMRIDPDSLTRIGTWIHPRIEPEIAFILGRTIDSPLTASEAIRAIDAVTVGAEVIDSRFTDFRFRAADVIADNTSAAGILLGDSRHRLSDIGDLATLGCELEVDGAIVHSATGAAILGHPLRAIELLSRHLGERGESVPAGSVVLAGALTDAVTLSTGRRYTLRIQDLGSITTVPFE